MSELGLSLVIIVVWLLGAYVGSNWGRFREQNRLIPEINEANETVARLRLLSKLEVCLQCEGQQNVYNRLTEAYQPCSVCGGTGEFRHD